MKRKLALLCDYGLDDAAATLYLLKNAEKFQIIDIVAIGGNFPLLDAFENAKRLLYYAENIPQNVRLVDATSIKQPEEKLDYIHGKDGMGDVLPTHQEFDGKIINYNDWLNETDDEYTIVSLGPCTITLDILKKTAAKELLMMGGNIEEEPNYNGYEFNHGMDAEAFAECVKYSHKIATLDTCHHPLCDFYNIDIKKGDLFYKMVSRAVTLSKERKEKGCYVYDLIAVVYLTHPEKFDCEIKKDPYGNTLSVLKYIGTETIL